MILYTAAHGVQGSEGFPLGGGAAIARMLCEEWSRTQPFPFRLLGPSILGRDGPSGREIAGFSETQYGRFCRRFEEATTREILRHDPGTTVVLVNDVSEGPDFRKLAEAGFRVTTIYHVDVVDYVARIYLRGLLKPETTVRLYDWLPLPGLARLVWSKQRDSVRYSRQLVMPSGRMREVMERCYPAQAPGKITVLPWGAPPASDAAPGAVAALRREFNVPEDALVLLTLSRISPEKGQDTLLEALTDWQPSVPVWLFICGEPAFMQGRRHMEKLRNLATRVRHVRVVFPGHVTGERKQAFFAMAHVYVFPSRHESYGLTLMEAFRAGLPAVCLDHSGAREIMRPEFGEVVQDGIGLREAIERLDAQRLALMRDDVRAYAASQPFSLAASRLAELVRS